MKGQGSGWGKGVGKAWSRRHVMVTRLPEATDGNEREKDRLKCPERCKGSKDRENDGKHLGQTD